jgi:H+/Cl- antiporter ClcA
MPVLVCHLLLLLSQVPQQLWVLLQQQLLVSGLPGGLLLLCLIWRQWLPVSGPLLLLAVVLDLVLLSEEPAASASAPAAMTCRLSGFRHVHDTRK